MSPMSQITWRPIQSWPGELLSDDDRRPGQFKVKLDITLRVLRAEIDRIQTSANAREVVIEQAYDEADLRLDGRPRANAVRRHPGVIVSFDSRHGPLRYWTDMFRAHEDNIRAIALGLEALRKLDRYGIAGRGEQYTGWKALGSGIAVGPAGGWASTEDAARFLLNAAWAAGPSVTVSNVIGNSEARQYAWRLASKRHHPDVGGDHVHFVRIKSAYDFLESR